MNMEGYDRYVGQVFDNRYRILKTIGVGGMAVVFEAYDLLQKTTVAVKMLKDESARDAQQVRRFLNESKAVAMLSHPNIVKIYNISVKGDIKFIVMEYIEGITLKDYMTKRGVLSLGEIISYSEQILHALEHAHSKGIVHRDIKPQNIMLLKNGVIKVTDFGIAKLPNAETLTLTDKAIGTVFYISPEQAEGKDIDQRSDLYSLGVMMYEMSCGRLPFYDESPISVALMQIKNDPVPPRTVNPSIPRGLEQITLSAMEKEPELRFQSASQMLRQLARLKADPNIVFRPSQKVENVRKQVEQDRKNEEGKAEGKSVRGMLPIILGVVAAFVVVVTVSLIYGLTQFKNAQKTTVLVVPNVVGDIYTSQDAVGLISSYYIVEVEEKYDVNSAAGTILDQDPSAESRVKISKKRPKATVKIVVSRGAETIILENYENQSLRDVKLSLRKLGISCEEQPVYDNKVPSGKVCYTYPGAGETAAIGSTVILYYSQGKASGGSTVEVPDFKDHTETEARGTASELMLNVTVKYEGSDQPSGTVIAQSILPGTSVDQNTSITLTVSGGQSFAEKTVPNITGKNEGDARILLAEVGLTLGKRTEKASELAEGLIIEQTPVPGTAISAGVTKVDYVVSNGEYEAGGSVEFTEIDGYQVPNIIGMTVKKAKKLLEDNELALGSSKTVQSREPVGIIVNISLSYNDNGEPVIDYEISGGLG